MAPNILVFFGIAMRGHPGYIEPGQRRQGNTPAIDTCPDRRMRRHRDPPPQACHRFPSRATSPSFETEALHACDLLAAGSSDWAGSQVEAVVPGGQGSGHRAQGSGLRIEDREHCFPTLRHAQDGAPMSCLGLAIPRPKSGRGGPGTSPPHKPKSGACMVHRSKGVRDSR